MMSGNKRAHQSLLELGKELVFGSLESGSFTYCGKKIEQFADHSIRIPMVEYHENLFEACGDFKREEEAARQASDSC